MGRPSDLTQEQKEEIYSLYKQGYSSVKIGEIFNKSASCIMGYIKRAGIKSRSNKENSRVYNLDHDFFESIDSEEKAYWLGFIYADGYVTGTNKVGITLSSEDENHLLKFKEAIKATYPVNTYEIKHGYKPGNYCSRILVTSEKMRSDLIKHGCFCNKTNIITAPNIDKRLSKHFIRGYLDGDGCITSTKRSESKSAEYAVKILGTDSLLDYIKEYIFNETQIVIGKYYKRRPEHIVSSLELKGNIQVKKFLDSIYEESNIHLDRKYDKYLSLKSYYDGRA